MKQSNKKQSKVKRKRRKKLKRIPNYFNLRRSKKIKRNEESFKNIQKTGGGNATSKGLKGVRGKEWRDKKGKRVIGKGSRAYKSIGSREISRSFCYQYF